MPDRSTLTPAEISQILVSTVSERYALGKNTVTALDRLDTPTQNMFRSKLARGRATPVQGGYKVIVKEERRGRFQAWSGRDLLTFDSFETMFDLVYSIGRVHLGEELVLQQLEEAGIRLDYDTSNGQSPNNKVSAGLWEVVVNLLSEKIEDYENNYRQELEKHIWRANTGDPKMFTGIDGLLPVTSNSTGTIGGKSRSNPVLRHHLSTGVAVADLELLIMQLARAANKRNGGDGSKVDLLFAGEDVYDGLVDHLFTGANAKYERQISVEAAAAWGQKMGVGMPTDALMVPNIGVLMVVPVFEQLDAEDAPNVPWQKRLYGINSKHVAFKPTSGMDGKLIPHPVPYNQRIMRISDHGEYAFCIDKPNSHFVIAIA